MKFAAAVEEDVEPARVTVHVAYDNRTVAQRTANKLQNALVTTATMLAFYSVDSTQCSTWQTNYNNNNNNKTEIIRWSNQKEKKISFVLMDVILLCIISLESYSEFCYRYVQIWQLMVNSKHRVLIVTT